MGPADADPIFRGNRQMKITGITAEFNPLHNGHIYFMDEARRITGADALVVAMSGDFVQRGEAAILSKHERARAALDAGADLVIEIPTLFCLQDASRYAAASVHLLEACGSSVISFGSETGDTGLIKEASDDLIRHREFIAEGIAHYAKEGMSYPAAREKAYERAISKEKQGAIETAEFQIKRSILGGSNDILGLEYIAAMKAARPLAVKRIGASYADTKLSEAEYQSAGAIRAAVADNAATANKTAAASNTAIADDTAIDAVSGYIPEVTRRMLRESVLTRPDDCIGYLKYALLGMEASDIEDCPSAGEGLGNILKRGSASAGTLEDLIMHAKSKRYTYTRISRLCMQVLLGISRSRYPQERPSYIRILGFSDAGRKLIADIKEKGSLPVITNINKEADALDDAGSAMLRLDIHAADVYNLISGRDMEAESDHRLSPVIKE